MTEGRSFDRITLADLRYLRDVAITDTADFVARHPKHATLIDRRIGIALCQGAALHFAEGENGVKDFDVWSFFERDDTAPDFPPRRPRHVPFERPGFDASMRKIDLLGRTLKKGDRHAPVEAIRAYLTEGQTASARFLAKKAIVMLEPSDLLGEVVWSRGAPASTGS